MHLIVGLGNPGKIYAKNRHNVGFQCLDYFAARHGLSFDRKRFRAAVATGKAAEVEITLAKPQTYMNLSGTSVAELVRWYKIPLSNLLVIHDDLDLPLGSIRIRARGSSGGHRGLQSIIEHLHTQDFPRLRVGIGRPQEGDPQVYVLQNFSRSEQEVLKRVYPVVADAVETILAQGIAPAMNTFNSTAV